MDKTDYNLIQLQLKGLAEAEKHWVPLMANASALLWEALPGINWAGFYCVSDGRLVLGPFQGKTACIHIEKGKGVCGTAWDKDEAQLVPDVHKFPGHIACDSASNSEIVIPIHSGGSVRAVLDIDSPLFERFGDEDLAGLSGFVKILEDNLVWG